MPIRVRKRYDELVSDCRLYLEIAEEKVLQRHRHYYDAFLWQSRAAMLENTLLDADGSDDRTRACCCHTPTRIRIEEDGAETVMPRWKLGEVHFVQGDWDVEVVVHELAHAQFETFRSLDTVQLDDVMEQNGDAEETACYRLGRWVQSLGNWLAHADPQVEG